MSRLQKKCFIASAALHLLLFALLVVGPAFISSTSNRTDNLPMLDGIPAKLIDEAMYGGGQPAAAVKQTEPPPETKARSLHDIGRMYSFDQDFPDKILRR
jgi:hypothetical protein